MRARPPSSAAFAAASSASAIQKSDAPPCGAFTVGDHRRDHVSGHRLLRLAADVPREPPDTYGLKLGDEVFRLEVSDGEFRARRGEAEQPDALIRTDPNALAAVVFRGKRLGKAVQDGDVRIDGIRQAVNGLLRALT